MQKGSKLKYVKIDDHEIWIKIKIQADWRSASGN